MNRLFRRSRRRGLIERVSQRFRFPKTKTGRPLPADSAAARLVVESLENRMLLTTVSLPAGSLTETTFVYVDPEGFTPGDDPAQADLNILTIGTLSGLPPEKDIIVEILDYQGRDIAGDLSVAGGPIQSIGGGPGGFEIVQEIPPGVLGRLGQSINALATLPNGDTYGITATGYLVEIDTANGVVDNLIGQIVDTNNVIANSDVYFSGFDAASFDPVTGVLYAVVNGPTSFNAVGSPLSYGEVLITIELTDPDNDGFVEAEPAGRNPLNQADYSYSDVFLQAALPGDPAPIVDITTIVYDQLSARPSVTEPIFIGFDAGVYDAPKQFVTISLLDVSGSDELLVTTVIRAAAPAGQIIEGLMFDNQAPPRLFGLWHDEILPTDNDYPWDNSDLVIVNLPGGPATYTPIGVDYGDDDVFLTGMSFDSLTGVGYATDPVSRTLYQITVTDLVLIQNAFVINSVSDIYMMYIASCTADTYISLVHNDGAQDGQVALLFVDEDNSSVETPGNAGGAMIGTIPQLTPAGTEITWSPGFLTGFGTFFDSSEVVPDLGPLGIYPGGAYRPGIQVAADAYGNPQHIGKILIGGGVFGDVEINGSMGTFYAGFLGTNRFLVDGQVQNVVVGTQAGGIEESDGSWTPVGSIKYGGDGFAPVLEVQGVVNSIYSNDDWGLPVLVHGRSDVATFPGILDPVANQYYPIQREIERHSYALALGGLRDFDEDFGIVNTNSPATAQYLGAANGTINLVGIVEGGLVDPSDYYQFSIMAGQTVRIQVYYPEGEGFGTSGDPYFPGSQLVMGYPLNILDPNLTLVATLGEVEVETGAPLDLEFTAERAGTYTVEMLAGGHYRLEISNTTPATLGGISAVTDTRDLGGWTDARPLVQVLNGSMGGMNVGEILRCGQIRVDKGSLGGILAGSAGNTTVGFNWEIGDTGGVVAAPDPSVAVSGRIGEVFCPVSSVINVTAGGDIQSVRSLGNHAGMIVSNRNIGNVSILGGYSAFGESWAGGFIGPTLPGIFANADRVGDPGIIDRIYVGGDMGANLPVSTGPRGGNVRFVYVEGSMYYSIGGWTDAGGFGPFIFEPGQSVIVTDDSGSQVKITPDFQVAPVEDVYFYVPTVEDDDDDQDPDAPEPVSGQLSLTMMPIWDISYQDYVNTDGNTNRTLLGYALTQIDSTDGLRVSSQGGPVEIGTITVAGVESNQVVFNGQEAISVLELSVSGIIDQVRNNTPGGDLVSIIIAADTGDPDAGTGGPADPADIFPLADQPFGLIYVDGNLGLTRSTTGQIVETTEFNNVFPIGSQTTGLFSEVGIDRIVVTGALGDAQVTADVVRIVINEDNSRQVGQFDGVAGAVLIDANLQRIELGDGIRHPGTGFYARSGLFVAGAIQTAEIEGAGRDIAGPLFSATQIDRVLVSDGARILGYNAEGGTGERVRGSFYMGPTIAITSGLDDFQLYDPFRIMSNGSIGLIEVKGQGSEIRGAEISSAAIGTIRVVSGALGIFDSRITAMGTGTLDYGQIGQIIVGGEGIHNTVIKGDQYIDQIKLLNGSSLADSEIRSAVHINSVSAPQISRTDIDAINLLEKVSVKGEIFDLVIETGELGSLTGKQAILGSAVFVAGPVRQIQSKGDIICTIELTGPYGDLGTVKAGGDIGTPVGGEIIVDGTIGTIQAGGDFLADLLLNWADDPVSPANPQGPHIKYVRDGVELNQLKAGGRIVGLMDIGGDVNCIQSGGEFGVFGSRLTVYGDLNQLKVGSGKAPSDLESSLEVKGSLKAVTIYGSVNGQIDVVEDFHALTMKGTDTHRADLNASITVGGDFDVLNITNGDIGLTDVVDGGPLTIDVGGTGPQIDIKGSDIAGTVIVAGGDGINIDGSITATGRYISTGDVGTLRIQGNIEAGGVLDIEGDLDELIVEGTIYGIVRVTGTIGRIDATNILGAQSIVTAGQDIGSVAVEGLMRDTYVLAGFAVGEILDADGNLLMDRDAQVLAGTPIHGDIDTVRIGTLENAVVAAGLSPGTNLTYGDLDGSDTPGTGLSTIGSVQIDLTIGTGAPFGVFADSEIANLRVAGARLPTPVSQADGFRSWTVSEQQTGSIGGFIFMQGLPFKGMINQTPVAITLSGPGVGEVLPGTTQIDTIQLRQTTAKTKITITAAGGATIDVGELFNGDDEQLGQLILDGRIADADQQASLQIGGDMNKLQLAGVGDGGVVQIDGRVDKAVLGTLESTVQASVVTIQGDVQQMLLEQVSAQAVVNADNIQSLRIKQNLDGAVNVLDARLVSALIGGDLGGVINSAGDIDRIVVKGLTGGETLRDVQGIRAAGSIGQFTTQEMYLGVVAAGSDLLKATVKGDMQYSTLAAGLDIGPGGVLFDFAATGPADPNRDTARRGTLDQVTIGGDFVQSNLIAGLAPGADNRFGTGDDLLEYRAIENTDAPQVANVYFDSTDLTAIHVQFKPVQQDNASTIQRVTIAGDVRGSFSPEDSFLIGAAGRVESVLAGRQAFGGAGNVQRSQISNKDVDAATLVAQDVTAATAATLGFRIRTDGLDHIFGTADDVTVSGDDDPLTAPTVWITFDAETNTATFHNSEGFAVNPWATNYYQITLDAGQVANKQGVPLDGDFEGSWPTGDGFLGGDFVYYFAVADLGNTKVTAFSPFAGQFPTNLQWTYESYTGDNPQYTAEDVLDESDYVRLNNLKQGEILNVLIEEDTGSGWEWYSFSENTSTYVVQLWQILDENIAGATVPAYGAFALDDIAADPDVDVPANLVVPELDELAFGGSTLYGYDGIGHQFYVIDTDFFSNTTLLDNTLDDLNSLIANTGTTILDLKALAGHGADSIWAVADVLSFAGARESLILINKLSLDVNNPDADDRAEVTLSDIDLSQTFSQIVGLEELNGVLYGIDSAGNTLIRLDSDPFSPNFGQATAVGNLGNAALNIAGLARNREGDGLIALHDQPADDFGNLMVDALYRIDTATGAASLLQEFAVDQERHGLATEPGQAIWVGLPLRNSPVGDTITIQFGDQDPQEHVFGSDTTDFSGGNTVSSDSDQILLNKGLQEFVDAGYYYAFDITYLHGAGFTQQIVDITDIDWLNETDFGTIISMTSDDPVYVSVQPLLEADGGIGLRVIIDAEDGDGDVRVYFAASSEIEVLQPPDLILAGKVIGQGTRTDLTPQRATIAPDLAEFTINSAILFVENRLDLTDDLKSALEQVLTPDLMGRIQDELTDDEITEVFNVLLQADETELLGDFLNAISTIEYDSLGYDTELETFLLISTTTYDARPIQVDPDALFPDTNPDNDVVLTEAVLSDLYNQMYLDADYTFDDIRALEFGSASWEETLAQIFPGADPTFIDPKALGIISVDDLFLVATVTISDPLTHQVLDVRDALLLIENILDPAGPNDPGLGMVLSGHDLEFLGLEDLRTLSFANMRGDYDVNGWIYGVDNPSQTLVRIDARPFVGSQSNVLVRNIDFGRAVPVGNQFDNLGNSGTLPYDLVSIDFAPDGKLYGIETQSQSIVEIFTSASIAAARDRLELVLSLPAGEPFRDLEFDNSSLSGASLLTRSVTGSPWGDTVELQLNGGAKVNHTFGSIFTTINNVVVRSSIGNDAASVNAQGGYRRFDITYHTGQGDLLLSIDDIDWLGGNGNIDEVFVSDALNASVVNYTDDGISVLIHTNHTVFGGIDTLTIYFGATSDMVLPTTGQRNLVLVDTFYSLGDAEMPIEIPADGDYVLQVSSNLLGTLFSADFAWIGMPAGTIALYGAASPLSSYDLSVLLFDDGNSDFGLSQTASGISYQQLFPGNEPVNLEPLGWGNTDLAVDPDDPDRYYYNPDRTANPASDPRLDWPITVEGSLLEPGQASTVTINADLGNLFDVDVFELRLEEGQRITVDLDAEALFGRDDVEITVAVYNGDFEAIATIGDEADDVLAVQASQQSDTLYEAQAIFSLPNHAGVVLDPQVNGLGTYYVVVSGYAVEGIAGYDALDVYGNQPLPYQLTIETTGPQTVENPPSQLVWLAFDGARADYLMQADFAGLGGSPNVVNRPAFDAGAFNLDDMRPALIQAIAAAVEQHYRNAGLTEDEIEFTTTQPAAGTTYSTVIFGGSLPIPGILGLAQKLDRHNEDRTDMAVVLTDEMARLLLQDMDPDAPDRFQEAVNAIAQTGAHELGHILGLEHATQINTDAPANLMGYNYDMIFEEEAFQTRNSYRLFAEQQGNALLVRQIGFENEVDLLLRYIGSGTEMGL
ncbi:MAG: hypothetical protein JW810_00035 [Sedimentisphaerales bacterium]|nr:hypothetical protein [Sedimentisphaerales bacterium]